MKKRMIQKLILSLEVLEYKYFLKGDLYRAAEIEEIINILIKEEDIYESLTI